MYAQLITATVTDREGVERAAERWRTEVRPGAIGFMGSTGGVTADGKLFVVARFESPEAAEQNANRPEQTASWSEMERCLRDITFKESTDVVVQMGGGRNDAGFVQVMMGRVLDEAAYADMATAMNEAEADMKEFRPEVLGGFTVRYDADRYADIIYFESEVAARAGEQKEMPAAIQAQFERMAEAASVEEYLDLIDPWLT